MTYSKLRFSKFKIFVSASFWEDPTDTDIFEFSNFLLQLKSQTSENNTVCGIKEKYKLLIKRRQTRKWKIQHIVLDR